MDKFIIDNSSEPITQQILDGHKIEAMQYAKSVFRGEACRREPGNNGSSIEFMFSMRSIAPDDIEAMTDDLLSIPREPLINPCL
jgi:hypothetical protein